MKVTEATVKLVWDGLVCTDRMSRYYGYLVHRLKTRIVWLNTIAAFSAFGAVWALLQDAPRGVTGGLAATVAFLNLWIAFREYHGGASRSVDLHRQLSRLLAEWEELWADVYKKDDDEIRARWRVLKEKQESIVERAPSDIPYNRSLVEKSECEVYAYRAEAHAAR